MKSVNHSGASRRARGLSLIELLIALAIGAVLILGLVQVFAASRTAYQLSEGMARTQENGRFAIDYLQRDIRMAGHYGCVNDQSHLQTANALTSHFTGVTPAKWGIDFPVSVRGYDATGTVPGSEITIGAPPAGWVPALPAAINALVPAPLRGSDIIELRFLANEGVPVSTIAVAGATTTITVPPDRWKTLTDNGVAIPDMFGLADCSYADVFPAATTNGTDTITVAVPISRYTPQPAGQTLLFRAESMVYYIALGATGQPALYRARSNVAGAYTKTEELVEGVENMQLMFGLDRVPDLSVAPPSGYIDVQQPPSAVLPNTPLNWRRVGSVQVGLLMSSPDPAAAEQASAAKQLSALGVKFVPPATNDTKFRSTYEVTVAMRNRLYGN